MKPKHLPRLWCALMGVLPIGLLPANRAVAGRAAAPAGRRLTAGELALPRPPGPGTLGHGPR